MSKNFFLLFFFFFLSSCYVGKGATLASKVKIIVNPHGEGEKVSARRPTIFLDGGSKNCRYRPFKSIDARNILKDLDINKDVLDELFGTEEELNQESESSSSSGNSTSSDPSASEPVKTDVSDNWIKFGLHIENHNKPGYFLLINNISYVASATYRGETFSVSGSIDESYCDGKASFLYFISGGNSIPYKPLSRNPFYNLSIYLGGFEIIDRRAEPSCQLNSSTTGTNSNSISSSSSHGNSDDKCYGFNEIVVIPDYKVELTLSGFFLTQSGYTIESFIKRIHFFTRGSL